MGLCYSLCDVKNMMKMFSHLLFCLIPRRDSSERYFWELHENTSDSHFTICIQVKSLYKIQLHSSKQENNSVNDAEFISYETNSI